MTTNRPFQILMLPGDGIGPEVMAQVRRVMAALSHLRFEITEDLVGGAAIEAHGIPLSQETLAQAMAADAVLFGAVGGPQFDTLPFESKPERGLLSLRKNMELFANLRPALCFAPLAGASTLKREVIEGLDILIVRELTGGVYFGEPRGIIPLPGGKRRGVNTHSYTTDEIHRVARVAFELAGKRQGRVCSAEKSNVMEAGLLWREEVRALHAAEFPDIELTHMLADNMAMQLVRRPKQFDVILTDNLFGDILSDEAAMLTGSLGMLPSASLGARLPDGRIPALYEPIHGSAPDIAGQNKANPIAAILSFAMCLRYSFSLEADAARVERAVERALAQGLRTGDIAEPGAAVVSTTQMGDAIVAALS
ncbi:MAG TPA: 3-isopropylmalate dehydrogenase [Alphaproteobacteria bacterium]|nr:3-isopropylmalate dehydrogenase [Alphaproteobacteria bacterium]